MSLSGQVATRAQTTLTSQAATDLAPSTQGLNYSKSWDIVSGVGTNQADAQYSGQRTIPGGGNEDLDLAAGTLTTLGVVATFAKVKALIVEALSANTNPITVGGAPTNAFFGPFGAATHTAVLQPGGIFHVENAGAGWPVTAGTADLIRVAGANQVYKIVILGTTA
jgi:hypothetical protein